MEKSLPIAACDCHAHEPAIPAIDAGAIPHALRHGAVHGALNTLQPGESMILIAPHNPLPLLEEIDARPEEFERSYTKQGPEDWHIKFTRMS